MRLIRLSCLGVALLLLSVAAAQARVSHGYSQVFALDTVTAIDEPGSPGPSSAISTIYPNPSNPHMTIEYELATDSPITVAIFDLRGGRVRVLASGTRPSGRHQLTWDGRDDASRAAPTGTYFCRLTTPQGSQTKKLMLTR